MRTIAILILFFLPLTVAAQKDAVYNNYPKGSSSSIIVRLPENNHGEIEYSDVVKVDSSTGIQLYERAQNFLIHEFVSKKAVTQLDDKEEKTIIIKGNFNVSVAAGIMSAVSQPVVYMIFEIQCKDGRYRYVINQFEYRLSNANGNYSFSVTNDRQKGHGMSSAKWNKLLKNIDIQVKSMISDMQSSMVNHIGSDDW